jgi:membrane associated rhomboid family serine protease
MGLLSALAVYKPRKIGLALGVPAPMYLVLVSYLFINFAGLTGSSSVAYEAHLFGLLTGGMIGIWLRDREKDTDEDKEDVEEVSEWEQRIKTWERKYMFD